MADALTLVPTVGTSGFISSQAVAGPDPDRTHVHVLAQSRSTGTAEDGQGPPAARHAALSGAPHAGALAALDGITHTASELHTQLGATGQLRAAHDTIPFSTRRAPATSATRSSPPRAATSRFTRTTASPSRWPLLVQPPGTCAPASTRRRSAPRRRPKRYGAPRTTRAPRVNPTRRTRGVNPARGAPAAARGRGDPRRGGARGARAYRTGAGYADKEDEGFTEFYSADEAGEDDEMQLVADALEEPVDFLGDSGFTFNAANKTPSPAWAATWRRPWPCRSLPPALLASSTSFGASSAGPRRRRRRTRLRHHRRPRRRCLRHRLHHPRRRLRLRRRPRRRLRSPRRRRRRPSHCCRLASAASAARATSPARPPIAPWPSRPSAAPPAGHRRRARLSLALLRRPLQLAARGGTPGRLSHSTTVSSQAATAARASSTVAPPSISSPTSPGWTPSPATTCLCMSCGSAAPRLRRSARCLARPAACCCCSGL